MRFKNYHLNPDKLLFKNVKRLFWNLLWSWINPHYETIEGCGICFYMNEGGYEYISSTIRFIRRYSHFKESDQYNDLYWFKPGLIRPRLILVLKSMINYKKRRILLSTKLFFRTLNQVEVDLIENNYL